MRKAKATPSFEHYLASSAIDDDVLVSVLKGHLVVEALLVELLQLKVPDDTPWKWNFPTKTSKCVSFGFVTQEQADALNDLNDLRNDFAHILGHGISYARVFSLLQKASKGFDFSDTTIYADMAKSGEWYDVSGGVLEVLNAIYFDLAFALHQNGGANRMGG